MPGGYTVGADPGVVEVEQLILGDRDVAAPNALLDVIDGVEQVAVLLEELVRGGPFAVDECMPDEQFPREDRVDGAVVDAAAGHQRHSIQRHLLVGHRRTPALRPVGLAIGALDQIPGQALGPQWIDRRDRMREKS